MKLDRIKIWKDTRHLSAARNMALDQALFEHTASTTVPTARFYQWHQPAHTVGYFHQFDASDYAIPSEPVRRFTGGGVVEHGEDLTFVLNFPQLTRSVEETYHWIHQSIVDALAGESLALALEEVARTSAGGHCFTQSVTSDILDATGTKICGGAQRRSRGFVIHQGSIRLAAKLREPESAWVHRLVNGLAECFETINGPERRQLDARAEILVLERYGNSQWNRRPDLPPCK